MINPLLNKLNKDDGTPYAWIELASGTDNDYINVKNKNQLVSYGSYNSKGIAYLPVYKSGVYTVDDKTITVNKKHSVIYTKKVEPNTSSATILIQMYVPNDNESSFGDNVSKDFNDCDFDWILTDHGDTYIDKYTDSNKNVFFDNIKPGTYSMRLAGMSGHIDDYYDTFPDYNITLDENSLQISPVDTSHEKYKYKVERFVLGFQIVYKVSVLFVKLADYNIKYLLVTDKATMDSMTADSFQARAISINDSVDYENYNYESGSEKWLIFYCQQFDVNDFNKYFDDDILQGYSFGITYIKNDGTTSSNYRYGDNYMVLDVTINPSATSNRTVRLKCTFKNNYKDNGYREVSITQRFTLSPQSS